MEKENFFRLVEFPAKILKGNSLTLQNLNMNNPLTHTYICITVFVQLSIRIIFIVLSYSLYPAGNSSVMTLRNIFTLFTPREVNLNHHLFSSQKIVVVRGSKIIRLILN